MTFKIEFDGGTSCNIPRLGFGNGYGSYKINDEPIHRCNFNQPMSANAAEIRTLGYAVKAIVDRGIDPSKAILVLFGDSQIALNWARKCFFNQPAKVSKKATPEFIDAICELRLYLTKFLAVHTHWQPRLKSVATFGH